MSEPETTLDTRYSSPGAVVVPWEQAEHLLETAQLSWITTVRPDGRPHVTPLVAVWLDGALAFTTGAQEVKYANVEANPNVVMTTGCNHWDAGVDVVVEGKAARVTDQQTLERLAAAWAAKWDGSWRFEVRDGEFHDVRFGGEGGSRVFVITPARIYAHTKGEPFAVTRYRFQ